MAGDQRSMGRWGGLTGEMAGQGMCKARGGLLCSSCMQRRRAGEVPGGSNEEGM